MSKTSGKLSDKKVEILEALKRFRRVIRDARNSGEEYPEILAGTKAARYYEKAFAQLENAADEVTFQALKILGVIKPGEKLIPKQYPDWEDEGNWYKH